VLNWGTLEKKNSYQGKSALIKITEKEFAVIDLIGYQENDLGTYSDIEIQFKSGKTQRTKPSYELPEKAKVSGYNQEPQPKERSLGSFSPDFFPCLKFCNALHKNSAINFKTNREGAKESA